MQLQWFFNVSHALLFSNLFSFSFSFSFWCLSIECFVMMAMICLFFLVIFRILRLLYGFSVDFRMIFFMQFYLICFWYSCAEIYLKCTFFFRLSSIFFIVIWKHTNWWDLIKQHEWGFHHRFYQIRH